MVKKSIIIDTCINMTSGARRCTSLKVGARFVRVWAQELLNMLKISRSSACLGRVYYMYKFQISSARVTGAFRF